jgi:hypothetical protein
MATYRGYEINEQVGRLGLQDQPGVYRVAIGLGFEGPREVVERFIDKEIALEAFRNAHSGLMPWQVQQYGLDLNKDLLSTYEAADAAFVAVDRPYREGTR